MSEQGTYALRFLGGGQEDTAASLLRERFKVYDAPAVMSRQKVFAAGLDLATAVEAVELFAREAGSRVAMVEQAEYRYAFDPRHPRRGEQPLVRLRRHGTTLGWERGQLGEWTREREVDFESGEACEQAIAKECADWKARGLERADRELRILRRTSAREPSLEQAIRQADEPDEAMAVHADWLQRQGDPRGIIAALDLARARAESPEERARLDQAFAEALTRHRAHLFGPLHAALDFVRLTWRGGLVIGLQIEPPEHADPDRPRLFDDLELVDDLLALPICACLRTLWLDVDERDGKRLANMLKTSDPPVVDGLRELMVRSQVSFDFIGWPSMRGLERLALYAGKMTRMDLPNLRELDLAIWYLHAFEPLRKSSLPSLRSLTLRFWAMDPNEFARLLGTPFVKSLDTLVLCNHREWQPELARVLIDANGLRSVGRVELQAGEDEGEAQSAARALLIAARDRLPNFVFDR